MIAGQSRFPVIFNLGSLKLANTKAAYSVRHIKSKNKDLTY